MCAQVLCKTMHGYRFCSSLIMCVQVLCRGHVPLLSHGALWSLSICLAKILSLQVLLHAALQVPPMLGCKLSLPAQLPYPSVALNFWVQIW